MSTLKEFWGGVRSVREGEGGEHPGESAGREGRLPHLTVGGTLVIRFDGPERFQWWKGGQSVKRTVEEVRAWAGRS